MPGQRYDGKLCFTELQGAEDAYEWSFVAVPAQRGAGVLKTFSGGGEDLRAFLKRCGDPRGWSSWNSWNARRHWAEIT